MKKMLMFLLVLGVLTSPAIAAQDVARRDTVKVLNYGLGDFAPLDVASVVRLVGVPHLVKAKIVVVGYTDGNLFPAHCGDDLRCSERANEALGMLRGTKFVDSLEIYGVSRSQVVIQPKLHDKKGGEYRGVYVYIDGQLVTPDFRAAEDPQSQRDTALVRRVTDVENRQAGAEKRLADHDRRLGAAERTNAEQGDSLHNLAVEVNKLKSRGSFFENVDVGIGGLLITGQQFKSDVPAAMLFVRANRSIEGFGGLGYRPSGSNDVCGTANMSGAAGVILQRKPKDFVGGFGSVYASRNLCRDGEAGVNEGFLKRQTGGCVGLNLKIPLGSFSVYAMPGVCYSQTDFYTGSPSLKGTALNIGLGLRSDNGR